jgi:peptidylprolyl isomerase
MRERKARAFRRRIIALVVIVLVVASLGVIYYIYGNKPSSEPNKVVLRTSMGDITIQLYEDMPITTGNFKNLVKSVAYDGTIFHRVVANFVVQGGDTQGNVAAIQDELPNKYSNIRGSVAMAKTSEPNSATDQFYINLKDNSESLDSNYSVFGRVIAGMSVVDAIGRVPTDGDPNNKPLQDVTITKAEFVP